MNYFEDLRVGLGVRTCGLFLCFAPSVFRQVLLSLLLGLTSPVSLTGSYTKDEPIFFLLRGAVKGELKISSKLFKIPLLRRKDDNLG